MSVFVRATARRRARETHAQGDVQRTSVAVIAHADLGRCLLAEFVGTALLVIFGRRRARRRPRDGSRSARLRGTRGRRDLVRARGRSRRLHVRHDLGGAYQPGRHVLAGGSAALPVGRSGPVRRRTARRGTRARGPHQRLLRLARERPQRVGGTVVGAGFTKAEAAVAEGLGTFLLLATIMALAVDRRAPAGSAVSSSGSRSPARSW
jgi:hypothetical protein